MLVSEQLFEGAKYWANFGFGFGVLSIPLFFIAWLLGEVGL